MNAAHIEAATCTEASDTQSDQTATTEARIFDVEESRLEELERKFQRLSRRAKKLGVEPVGYELVGEHLEYQVKWRDHFGVPYLDWTKNPACAEGTRTGAVRVVKEVRLVGASEVKLAGWTFLATLDHELGEENTIVRLVPGAEGQLPSDYRHRGNLCDHCKRRQVRKATFVCKHEDGRLVQVGSTCVHDFLGIDAAQALGLVEMFALACGYLEDEEGFRQQEPTTFSVVEYLAWVAKDVRENGWVSRTQAREQGLLATADSAIEAYRTFLKQR